MTFLLKEKISDRVANIGIGLISLLAISFVVLIGLAIHFYPDNYAFFSNYLSDLGMTRTVPGNFDNSTSSLIFTIAMVVAGLLSLSFWLLSQNVIRFHVGLKALPNLLVEVAAFVGFVSTFFAMAIGFYHYDTNKSMHLTVGWIFFVLASGTCLVYGILFLYLFMSDTKHQLGYTILTVIITLVSAAGLDLIIKENLTESLLAIVIWLIVFKMVLEIIFSFKFEDAICYLSFLVSFVLIVSIIVIILLYVTIGLQPVMEVTFIVVISAFLMTNNLELIKIER